MEIWKRVAAGSLALVVVVVGCTAPATPTSSEQRDNAVGGAAAPAQRTGPKRVVAAILGADPGVTTSALGDSDALEELVSAGLGTFDDRGVLVPELAEAVPTLENGLWKLLPDGSMETTWRLREGARWHDGTPLTAEDLVFTTRVSQDRDLAQFRHGGFDLVDAVEAIDARTVTVRWKRAYIDADIMFTRSRGGSAFALPLPKHLLEKPFMENKASFTDLAFWSSEFVGSGPFKVQNWARGSQVTLAANDWYPLGRPKIDVLEVRFIPDKNTLLANILSGDVDVTTETNAVDVDEAIQFRERWRDGKVEIRFSSWITVYPQFLNPRPALVGDLQFRRALMHAMDRQQLADTFMAGLAPVAHGYLGIEDPDFQQLEGYLVKYDYDPRRAAQMVEALGYQRGGDNRFRDSANQPLSVGLRARPGAEEEKLAFAIGDQWQQVGVAVEPEILTPQQARDREYGAQTPSFFIRRHNNNLTRLAEFHTSQVPRAENSYRGNNIPRYSSPELDTLIDRFVVTIPIRERTQLAGQIIHHLSDQLVLMGLFYNAETTLVGNRLKNVLGRTQVTEVWKSWEWDLQ